MKKFFVVMLLSAAASIIPLRADEHRTYSSRSFMFTKPAYYDIVMEQMLWHDVTYNKKGTIRGGLQFYPYYQRSMSLNNSKKYFLINKKTELLVAGDDNIAALPVRDVRAEWLGINNSNFQGNLTVNPRQEQFGFVLEYSQDFKKWLDVMFIRDMYISIIAPFCSTTNNLNLRQFNVANQGTEFPHNIVEAFNQPSWHFGKINPHKKRRTNLAELKILLGTSYESRDYLQVNYNSVLVIPIADKQHAEWFFDPVVGNNHHMGVGAALNIQAPLNRDTTRVAFCFFLDLESTILIRNKQERTFDLRQKPWSRFLLMNEKTGYEPRTNVPGVNLMTYKAVIKPFNVVDFAMGWRTKTKHAEFEAGWGIWGHGYERIDHIKHFDKVFGIAGDAPGTTSSQSTIAFQAPNDADNTFVAINEFDLDLQSGANPGALNFRVFMSAGYVNIQQHHDTIFGAGWSIDLPYKNATLQEWKLWIKLGATF